jgi:hypothetical protein
LTLASLRVCVSTPTSLALIVPQAKQQPIIEGNTMKIYYTGGNGPFMGSRAAGFSLAMLQRDWWFGFTPMGNHNATVLTTAVTVGSAGVLLVSADARYGPVVVGVKSPKRHVSGLSVGECVPLQGNLTDGVVEWGGANIGSPLASLVGKNITLEFVLSPRAVLFAFALP